MIIFLDEFRQLLKSLIEYKIEFILIGGYAVNYHGYNRPTGDLDIWLKPDNTNRDKLISLLKNENFSAVSIKRITKLDFTQMVAFHFGKPPKRVDFLTKITGVGFEEAWKEKVLLPVENFQIPVLHLNQLILSKLSSNRLRDKADIEELQKVAKLKRKK
jgi:predicted nucleotidyltransferase